MLDHNAQELRAASEAGQALVEYAFIIAFVAIACAATVGILGSTVDAALQSAVNAL